MMNAYPIVFVHGILGSGRKEALGFPYLGLAETGVALARLRSFDVNLARRKRGTWVT